MSITGYNYVVSLIAYLKQNLQGFNARFEKGGGEEIGILMDTVFKRNLFWGKVSLGHGTEREEGRRWNQVPSVSAMRFCQNAKCWPIPSPAV